MSLQDIKQVLSKIISLNKNLDENRLNNLLEASGWEKQNKEDALGVFRVEQKKDLLAKGEVKQIAEDLPAQAEHKELSTEVIDQELSVVNDVNKKDMTNFIPANLPIKEEDRQEIFITNNKSEPVAPVINITPEKTDIPAHAGEKVIEPKEGGEKTKGINWVVWLAIALIIFLLSFGYMSTHTPTFIQ